VAVAPFVASLPYPALAGWDDPDHITFNSRLTFSLENIGYWFSHSIISVYMPLTMLSYMLDHAIWGLNPFGYRLSNVLLHLAAVIAVYNCFRMLKLKYATALFCALIFAIHPQRVESVVWLSERKDMLCAALYFWTVYVYLRSVSGGGVRYRITAFALFILALLAKPMAVSLPFVFLCIELHYRRTGGWKRSLKTLLPFFIPALALMPLTMALQSGTARQMDILRQGAVVIHNIYWTITSSILPLKLLPMYPRIEFTPALSFMLFLFYAVVAWLLYKLYLRVGRDVFIFDILTLIAAFLFALAPVAGFFQLGHIDYADRYTCIPSAFLWLGLGMLFQQYLTPVFFRSAMRRAIFAVMLTVYFVMLFAATIRQAALWQNLDSLIEYSCQMEYCNDMALFELALIKYRQRDHDAALDAAVRLESYDKNWMSPERKRELKLMALYIKGMIFFDIAATDEAYQHLKAAHELFANTRVRRAGIFENTCLRLYELEKRRGNDQAAQIYLQQYLAASGRMQHKDGK
jgi:hypothetical protein